MKKILLLLFLALSCVGRAQTKPVKPFEFEFTTGVCMPLGAYHNGDALETPVLAMNLRYNIKNTPWSCGFLWQIDSARQDFWHNKADKWQNNRTISLALTGEYNWGQGKKVNPFAGISIGAGFNQTIGDSFIDEREGASLAFIPKIGVELWHFLRVNTHLQLSRKGFHTYGFSLGFVLGGRPR